MYLFAATTFEKLHEIPRQVWINIGLVVIVFIVGFLVLRAVAQMNKIILSILVAVVLTLVGFNWIYSRNEPKFLSPLVDKLAPFFPSAADMTPSATKLDKALGR